MFYALVISAISLLTVMCTSATVHSARIIDKELVVFVNETQEQTKETTTKLAIKQGCGCNVFCKIDVLEYANCSKVIKIKNENNVMLLEKRVFNTVCSVIQEHINTADSLPRMTITVYVGGVGGGWLTFDYVGIHGLYKISASHFKFMTSREFAILCKL
jgi:hypothetical protein